MKLFALSVLALAALSLCGCGGGASYTLTFSGTAEGTGVIYFLDYSINVYQDLASNPCGTCADQPVHLYTGASAAEAAEAVAQVIQRADDLWDVKSCSGGVVVLEERNKGSVSDIGELTSVEGLAIEGLYRSGSVSLTTKSGTKAAVSGNTVTDAQRIAAVYGPSYEMLTALGVEDRIVVRADVHTDSFPWAEALFSRITELPVLDNVHTSVNFEELMRYEPDVVFSFPRQNELDQLAAAGVAAVPGESFIALEDTCGLLMDYANALGSDAVVRAQSYCNYFEQKLSNVRERLVGLTDEEKPRVYYAQMDVLTTCGKYSDLVEVIEAAGGIAVSAELEAGARTEINYEQLMVWNPDYIFLDHGGINDGSTVEEMQQELYTQPSYASLSAVQAQQVYLVPSGVFYWDMGLQKILLVEYMAQILHPERFEDLDMAQELMDFYQRFYGCELSRGEAEAILARQIP